MLWITMIFINYLGFDKFSPEIDELINYWKVFKKNIIETFWLLDLYWLRIMYLNASLALIMETVLIYSQNSWIKILFIIVGILGIHSSVFSLDNIHIKSLEYLKRNVPT